MRSNTLGNGPHENPWNQLILMSPRPQHFVMSNVNIVTILGLF